MEKAEFKAFLRDCLTEILTEEKQFFKQRLEEKKPKLVKIETVCQHFHISKQTVHNLTKRGKIRRHKLGKSALYSLEEIETSIR